MNPRRRLASWLARSLGEYVEHIDEDSIGVGLWSGDLLLQSLDLRRDALRNFQLPVILHSGVVGCLRLTIPWKSFGSGGVTLRVADVTLVLEPVGSGFYDEALEEAIRTTVDAKKQELLAQAERALSGAHSSRGGGWTSRLLRALAGGFVSRALKSLKVEIENINVIWRLTSSSATSSKAFPAVASSSVYSAGAAIGVRLERFLLSPSGTATTAGDAAAAAVVGSSVAAALAAKDLSLTGFSVYVIEEQAAALHAHQLLRQQLEHQQQQSTAAAAIGSSRECLLQPLAVQGAISLRSATAAASSAQPTAGAAVAPEAPLLYVALRTPAVRATLSSRGCATVLSALAELAMARRRFGYRRGRPTVPVMADPAAWWHFAVAAVRAEVRTAAAGSAQRLSWASVVRRARTRAVYMAAYRRLLLFGFAESQRTSAAPAAAATTAQQQQAGSSPTAQSSSSRQSVPTVQLSSEAKSAAAASTAVKQPPAVAAAATSSAKKLTGRDVKMLAVQARGQVTARVRALAAAVPAAAQLAGRITESEFLRLLAIEDSLSVEEILLYRGVARAQLQKDGADSAAANKGAVRRAYGWLTGSTTAAQSARDAAAGVSEAGAAAGSDDANAAAASHWLACGEDEIEQVAGVMLEPLNDDDSSSSSSSEQSDAPLLRWELIVGQVSAVCTTSSALRSSCSNTSGDDADRSSTSSAGVKTDLVLAVGVQKLTIDAYCWASGGSTCSAAVESVRAEGVGGCSLLRVRKGGTLRYDTRRTLLGVSSSSNSTGTAAADRQSAAAVAGGHVVDVVFTLRPTEVTVPAAAVGAITAFVSPACALPVLGPLLPPPPAAHEALRKLAAARRACSVPGHYEAARSRHTTYCVDAQLAGVCVTLEAAAAEQALRLTVGPIALRSGYHLTEHLAQAAAAGEGAATELDTELLALAAATRAAPLVETLLLQASGVDVALVRTLGTVSSSSSHVDASAADSSSRHSHSSSSGVAAAAAASTTVAADTAAFCWSAEPSSPLVRVVTAVTVAERGWGGDLLLARCVVPGHPTHPALRLDGVLSPLALDVSEQLVAAAACLSAAYKRALPLRSSSSSSSSNSSSSNSGSACSAGSSASTELVPVPRLAMLSPVLALQLSVRLAELQVRLLEPEEDDEVVDGAASSEGGGLAAQEESDAARMLEETRRCVQQVSQSCSTYYAALCIIYTACSQCLQCMIAVMQQSGCNYYTH
jgi:N-terminal region of Chorein or VPS13/Vacuolar sorting-associated protein 13, N-terminal